MKKFVYALSLSLLFLACQSLPSAEESRVLTTIDLVHVQNDRVEVHVNPGKFDRGGIKFFMPKTVPGTYEINNYGQFVEDMTALNYKGDTLPVVRLNKNTWKFKRAKNLDKITYQVNDTYDIKGEKNVFSPAGTNIEAGENFILNLHGFIGYFKRLKQNQYQLKIKRPEEMFAGTSLKPVTHQKDTTFVIDEFMVGRYFQLTDHPIMYSWPDTASFQLGEMRVEISLYSPNGLHSVEEITPSLKRTMKAQKAYLGSFNNTPVYSVLVYLSDMNDSDARGFGALEHFTSTTVVLPETLGYERLNKLIRDVVSHEFFHTITPLSVHSKEIHYFSYNEPEMSKHLWMYEGVTEYFALLFQVDQGLISHQDFYDRIAKKIKRSKKYNEHMSFTTMSENVYEQPYQSQYGNVYQKGALLAMALDIRLRELSGGKMGVLDLMKKLGKKFGPQKPFKDDRLFEIIVDLTYPEIDSFLTTYVSGTTPLPFEKFLNKVGVKKTKEQESVYFLFKDFQTPYLNIKPSSHKIFFRKDLGLNSALKELGIEQGDVLLRVNGKKYNLDNINRLMQKSMTWRAGGPIKMLIKRNGKKIQLSGTWTAPKISSMVLKEMDVPKGSPKIKLRKAWLGAGQSQ